jgi:hypothetical protein
VIVNCVSTKVQARAVLGFSWEFCRYWLIWPEVGWLTTTSLSRNGNSQLNLSGNSVEANTNQPGG